MTRTSRVLAVTAVVAAFAVVTAWAQAPTRVRGTIEKVDGDLLMVKSREGTDLKLKLKADASVRGVVKATLDDVKPGVMVGITSMPQADGTLKAVEIHIFPAGQNVNQFHGPWDLMPNSQMTNGAVQASVAGVDGQVTTQTNRGDNNRPKEKKIVVPPKTIIVKYAAATKAALKAGHRIFAPNATKRPDGPLEVASTAYGKNTAPPM